MDILAQLFAFLMMVLPIIILAFLLRWIRLTYKNSEQIVNQNEQMIQLLKEQNNSLEQ